MKSDITILIATHKHFSPPKESIYVPLHVGAISGFELGYQRDNEGENISELNPYFSELTGLYWAWKNLKSDMIGLVHYRRYLGRKRVKYKEGMDLSPYLLDGETIHEKLRRVDIIVPQKRRYYIESLYSHYANTLDKSHLDKTRKIIQQDYSSYLESFDRVMKQRSGYMFNMFVMKKDLADQYCEWLFGILFKLQDHVDTSCLEPFEARLFGRVSELLFNVWLEQHQYSVAEVPLIDAFQVNWFKKGGAFLAAKFLKRRYKKSF